MPAMHPLVVTHVRDKVGTMMWRHLQLTEFDLSHDECLKLVAPPEHHDILKTAAHFADITSSEGWMNLECPGPIDGVECPKFRLNMRTHEGQEPPLRPRTAFFHQCGIEVESKVYHWLERRLYHGRMSATTKWVVDQLAERCDRGEQMRFLYPSIMLLIDLIDDTGDAGVKAKRWKDKFGIFKAQKSVPHLPSHLREAIRETSQWLTQGLMLSEVHQRAPGAVTISLGRTYTFELYDGDGMKVVLERD